MNFVFWTIFLHFSEKLKSSELLDKAKFMPVFLFFFSELLFFWVKFINIIWTFYHIRKSSETGILLLLIGGKLIVDWFQFNYAIMDFFFYHRCIFGVWCSGSIPWSLPWHGHTVFFYFDSSSFSEGLCFFCKFSTWGWGFDISLKAKASLEKVMGNASLVSLISGFYPRSYCGSL